MLIIRKQIIWAAETYSNKTSRDKNDKEET